MKTQVTGTRRPVYSIAIHPDSKLAVFHFHGAMTLEEGRTAFLDYVQRPHFDATATMITDARHVTSIAGDFLSILGTVFTMGEAFRHFRAATRSIILVADDVQFGMARVLEQVLDQVGPIQIVVVRTEHEFRAQTGLTLRELNSLK